MIARELEVEKRKVERVLAAAGGASVGVGISFFVEAFRIIGGPTIVAQILRTPGAHHSQHLPSTALRIAPVHRTSRRTRASVVALRCVHHEHRHGSGCVLQALWWDARSAS